MGDSIPARRLEDRIRELASRIKTASNSDLPELTSELRVAMSEYALRVNNKNSAAIISWPDYPSERRKPRDFVPPNSPQESSSATAKATMDEITASCARLNQASTDFLRIDVQTALTFCEIARESQAFRKKLQNRQYARGGYDTILRLMNRVKLMDKEAQFLIESLEKLRGQLVNLGELL